METKVLSRSFTFSEFPFLVLNHPYFINYHGEAAKRFAPRKVHSILNGTLMYSILQYISCLYAPSQHPRHYSHYKLTISPPLPSLLSHSPRTDVLGEADLARKTSLIFEALQRFTAHAQWRRRAAGGSQRCSAGVIPSIACVSVQSTYSWL